MATSTPIRALISTSRTTPLLFAGLMLSCTHPNQGRTTANTMSEAKTLVGLLVVVLLFTACREKAPDVEWQLSVDGDVNQPVTYTYQDLAELRQAKLTDVLTRNPDDPDEKTSWEGVTLFLVLQEPGGVEYSVESWARITLADGTTRRVSLADLRGALIALKDAEGNWLAETDQTPLRLIAPNQPSSLWLEGPVRITIHAP